MATDFGKASALGLDPIANAENGLLGFPAATPDQSFLVKPGAGADSMTSFSMVFDLYIPSDVSGTYGGLFQLGLSNSDDADFFIKKV
ncbi:MAG: hypothetical protein MI743_01680, partial [Sneathiellales bacterium]|nr:hypothetical protein [Sneathiellales bacterium]